MYYNKYNIKLGLKSLNQRKRRKKELNYPDLEKAPYKHFYE